MKSPCYNTETQTDCPKRKAGCATNCIKWAVYVRARDAEYKRRAVDISAKSAVYDLDSARIKEHYRKLKSRKQRGKLGYK